MSDQLMRFETILNNSRYRSIIAGGVGGLLGWLVAETVVPIVGGPKTFSGVGLIGAIVGAGIGIALGIAEGLVIRNWHQVRRGAIVGATVGALGGVIGAVTAQSVSTSAGGGSAFSTEMQDRLAAAGAKKGAIEVALSWENTNDLDLHVIDPNGARVWFRNKSRPRGENSMSIEMLAAFAPRTSRSSTSFGPASRLLGARIRYACITSQTARIHARRSSGWRFDQERPNRLSSTESRIRMS